MDIDHLKKPYFIILKTKNFDWIVLCLIEIGKKFKLLCKNSFKSDLDFRSQVKDALQPALPNFNFDNDIIFNENAEQNLKNKSNSGVFALKNMDIIFNNLELNAGKFITQFKKFNEFCNEETANSLRKFDFANKYALGLLRSNCYKSILKDYHQIEAERIFTILNSYSSIKEINAMQEDNEELITLGMFGISFDIGLLFEDYSYYYRIDTERIKDDVTRETFLASIERVFKLTRDDCEPNIKIIKKGNPIRIPMTKLKDIIFPKSKLLVSELKLSDKLHDLIIPFQETISNLNIDDKDINQKEMFINAIKESKTYAKEHIQKFEEDINLIKILSQSIELIASENDSPREKAIRLIKDKGWTDAVEIASFSGLGVKEVENILINKN